MEINKSTTPSINKITLSALALFSLLGCNPEEEKKEKDLTNAIPKVETSMVTDNTNKAIEKGPKINAPIFVRMGYDAYDKGDGETIINDHSNHISFTIKHTQLEEAKRIIANGITEHVDENGGHDKARELINEKLTVLQEADKEVAIADSTLIASN